MTESKKDKIVIRTLSSDDYDGLVRLDAILLGSEKRREYWEKKFAIFRLRHPNLSLVATINDQVVGFIMGNISGWEFGVSAGIGWVELMGVHPDYQRKGVAKEMMNDLLKQFKTLDVKTVYTMIVASDSHIKGLFNSVGFKQGHMMQLETDLK